jgi:hypothetical protein
MKDNVEERILHPKMEYYRWLYADSKKWDGKEDLSDKHVLLYGEQGYGDIIQMARYFKNINAGKLTVHCPHALCSLVETLDCVDATIPREEETIPEHDYHVLSLSLPFLVEDPGNGPYLSVEPMDLSEVPGKKIGIAWEGNPNYPKNMVRSCPLKYFKKLTREDRNLFMVQIQKNLEELCVDCEDMELLGVPMGDFLETARLIQAMDVVVSVDTSLLHLAGALGKKAYGILAFDYDRRWMVRKWYDSVEMWRQPQPGDWAGLFETLPDILT